MESTNLTSELQMEKFVAKNCYLVIFPDKKTELFKSLRNIQNSICVDASTISKKLKNDEHLFVAKGTGFVFYITKFH